MNLLDLFEIRRRERPGAVALMGESGARWSYGELLGAVEEVALGLAGRGVGAGDRVAFLSGNRVELVVAHLAVLRLGAVAVPVNAAYKAREVGHVLGDCEPRVVVAEAEHAGVLEEVAAEERRSVEHVLLLDELESWRRSGEELGKRGPDGSDPALIVYTSGTTGKSKGAVLTHDNLLATVTGLLAAWAWREEDVLLLTLPLFHVHGLVVGLYTALAAGARVELRRRFDAGAVAHELTRPASARRARSDSENGEADRGPEETAPTVFFGVPTMYVRLVEELRRRRETTSAELCHPELREGSGRGRVATAPRIPSKSPPAQILRKAQDDEAGRMRLFASGSAPLAPETFQAFRELTGHEILERYGMSEAGMLLSNPYAGPRRPGTVGVPLPGVSVRVADPEGRDVPAGEAGELQVAGSNVFAGYWRDPEKTAGSFVADATGRPWLRSWFRTGDLARRDPETGYFTLLGRTRELILRGGFNVYPREIEEVLAAAPGVREAAVAARPHPEWGEVPVAWVVAADGPARDPEALLAHCRDRLASFKVPAEIRFVDALPKNALGKVQKHLLGET